MFNYEDINRKKILRYLDIIKEVLYLKLISQVHLLMSVTFRQQSYSILIITKDLIKLGGHIKYKINSSKYQKRGKGLIHIFLTQWLKTFNWIHFLKGIIVPSNFFFLYITPYENITKNICDFHLSCSLHSQHNQNNLYALYNCITLMT